MQQIRPGEASEGQRILVVEDNEFTRAIAGRAVEMSGRSVVTCGTAAQAYEALAVTAFDVVLVDLNLPDATGILVLSTVAAVLPNATRLLMTADAGGGRAASADHGDLIERLLLKPLGTARLLSILDDLEDI